MLLSKMKLSASIIRLFSGGSRIFRRPYTAVKPPMKRRENKRHEFFTKLSSIWSTGEKVSDVLDHFSRNQQMGLKISDLLHCIRVFRSYGRYQLCLEILEWMEKDKTDFKDEALRLNLIYKVKGIDEAEKYFNSLPVDSLKPSVYGTLLNCYCSEKMIDKALALFEKMDKLQYTSSDVNFANLMCMYIKLDQPDQVPILVEEMKRREIPLSTVSYQTWVHSLSCLNDLEGVERVMDEVQNNKFIEGDWRIYGSSASVFIKARKYEKAKPLLKKLEENIDKSENPDRYSYRFLISLYAGVGDSESLVRVWDKFKSKFKACDNLSYLSMLQALSNLGNLENLKECFKEWDTRYKSYDVRLPLCVMRAYLKHDMFDEAKEVFLDVKERSGQKIWRLHVCFMEYFLKKCEINSALEHLEAALSNDWDWQRHVEKVDKFFEYFIQVKDVESAERLSQMLEKDEDLPLTICLGLLRTYVAAGKTAPKLRQRMERVGKIIGTEYEELLDKVCPN